jgi:hypothetical protein
MMQTTFIGGLGMFVFALSTFTPTQRFGTLMLVMLFAALLGDLVLLPAILAGPLGRWFRPRTPVPTAGDNANVGVEAPIELASAASNFSRDGHDSLVAAHARQTSAPAPKALDRLLEKQRSLSRVKPRRDNQ